MSEELIRRSDAIKAINVYDDTAYALQDVQRITDGITKVINAIPTIEPKRGEWIEVPFNEKCKYIVCSECGNKFATDVIIPLELFTKKHKFCHNCGADMREREGE